VPAEAGAAARAAGAFLSLSHPACSVPGNSPVHRPQAIQLTRPTWRTLKGISHDHPDHPDHKPCPHRR
jgi:hypothetical protein